MPDITFEPIDEKDFQLEMNFTNNIYKVTLFLREAILFDDYEWKVHSKIGLQMKVKREDIINFSNELRKEYLKL